jgi:hypothetical protein
VIGWQQQRAAVEETNNFFFCLKEACEFNSCVSDKSKERRGMICSKLFALQQQQQDRLKNIFEISFFFLFSFEHEQRDVSFVLC